MMRVVIIVMLAGCDWSLHRMQEPVGCRENGATDLLPDGSCHVQSPAGAVAMDSVDLEPPLTRALVLRGRNRFERICAACHGARGDGDSPVARTMQLRRPPSLVAPAARALSDARLLDVITYGYGLMPSYRALLGVADRHAVVHYVRVLQQREVPIESLPMEQQMEARRWLR
jgi:mono/diheme cytochrome c family protein